MFQKDFKKVKLVYLSIKAKKKKKKSSSLHSDIDTILEKKGTLKQLYMVDGLNILKQRAHA